MRYHVLATDYDGTLASHGQVDDATLTKLKQVRLSGRKLVMVTGRELADLARVFPQLDCFDLIVAENGALLYRPSTREERRLGEPPPEAFVTALRQQGMPLSVGRVIVATWEPHEIAVLEAIREQGLELQVIFNKGAVMVLPTGINKASGLQAALVELSLSPRNCVGVGDAENDLAFLNKCEFAVAVANALDSTCAKADWVTPSDHGTGVGELMDALLQDDLASLGTGIERHGIPLGTGMAGQPYRIPAYNSNLLLAGTSGSGKSTAATAFLEHLSERGYQFCIVDPEGDYASLPGSMILGDEQGAPGIDEIMTALEQPDVNLVINLVDLPHPERPDYFNRLLPRLLELRERSGRPHWLLVDEAHHVLPRERGTAVSALARELQSVLWITVHPDHLSRAVLERIETVVAIGNTPGDTLQRFAAARGCNAPPAGIAQLPAGEALLWSCQKTEAERIRIDPPRALLRRHKRKYAQGDLGPELSFYFQGPERKLNLRANNLLSFLQLAAGVDDATWDYHLRRGDYSRWFRTSIKDAQLAEATRAVERTTSPAPDSRARIRAVVEERYTGPV